MAEEIVLITGCSSGIGLALAVLLAKQTTRTFKVYASMRDTTKKDALLEKAGGCNNLFVIKLDVCSQNSIDAAVKEILEKEGRIDILVNNAGVGLVGVLEAQPWDRIVNMYDINVFGPLRMIRTCVPLMKEKKKGRIINISAVAGMIAMPFTVAFASTKYALEGITESLAPELDAFNIPVIAVELGPVDTSFSKKTGFETDEFLAKDAATKEIYDKVMNNCMKEFAEEKLQTAEECAEGILKAVTDETPQHHYFLCKKFEEEAKAKYCDITGKKPFENSKKHLL